MCSESKKLQCSAQCTETELPDTIEFTQDTLSTHGKWQTADEMKKKDEDTRSHLHCSLLACTIVRL